MQLVTVWFNGALVDLSDFRLVCHRTNNTAGVRHCSLELRYLNVLTLNCFLSASQQCFQLFDS
jgi:hypothetical protein